jgi:hypothetical protein
MAASAQAATIPAEHIKYYMVQNNDIIPLIRKTSGSEPRFLRADIPLLADHELVLLNPDYVPYYPVGNNQVPIPAALWLFGSAIVGLATVARRKKRHV